MALIIVALIFFGDFYTVFADGENGKNGAQSEAIASLEDNISQITESVDFGEMEKFIDDISGFTDEKLSVKDIVYKFVRGESVVEYQTVFKYVGSLLFAEVKSRLPALLSLLSVLLLCSLLGCLNTERLGSGVGEIVHFVGYAAIVTTVTALCYSLVSSALSAVDKVSSVVQAVFPALLALMISTGATAQAALYSPTALFIDGFTTIFIKNFTFPCVLAMLALSVVSNITKTVKLKGFIDFLSGIMKWGIGLAATVFSLFLTVKGISGGLADGVTVRTLKYALNSSVPLVGGILSGGADVVVAAASLVRGALGLTTLVIVFGVVLMPVIKIAALTLALRVVNAVAQPFSSDRVYSFINSAVSVLHHALAGLLLATLMYVVTIIMIVLSVQAVF
ncbi:MAG: stage III sporulation protein AE [Clostridia bacterium]|nr:stage III sporulation protein AE [Clostridia bacterium]MDY2714265.1 stage III sporulation protein AE [Christensenellaceae bacterium]